jgi:hypothetical protein
VDLGIGRKAGGGGGREARWNGVGGDGNRQGWGCGEGRGLGRLDCVLLNCIVLYCIVLYCTVHYKMEETDGLWTWAEA